MVSEPSSIVLVVDDEIQIRRFLRTGFELNGFVVHEADTGAEAIRSATLRPIDLVIVDLGLPDMDGSEVVERIRSWSSVPIIVLSVRSTEAQKVHLLELGADDYVVKPFGLRELVARIRAVVRRSSGEVPDRPQAIGALRIDRRARRVHVGEQEVALTPKEYDVLARLAEEPGAVVRRREILDAVWEGHWYGPTKTLDVHVAAIRRKLGDPGWIETVRSVGFRLGNPA